VSHKGSRFILINSAGLPEGGKVAPYKYWRGKQLDSSQIDFVNKMLSDDGPHQHIFLFMGHLLWWSENDSWWRNVHPILVGKNVRAVFSGEFGPLKFSHMEREGIEYIQSGIEIAYSLENPLSLDQLRSSEGARLEAQQFDTFLYVTVKDYQVDIEVKTVGAFSSGKFSPERFHDIFSKRKSKLQIAVRQVAEFFSNSKRLVLFSYVLIICFSAGIAIGRILNYLRFKKDDPGF
jgi:hypothetical protein